MEDFETLLLHFTLELVFLEDQDSLNGYTPYMKSYMACNAKRFMAYQILRQANLKEVGPTQNQETMTLQNLTTLDLLSLMCRRVHMNRMVVKYHLFKGPVAYAVTLYLRPVTTQNLI